MTTLQLPDSLVKRIREAAEAVGVTIPDLIARLLDDQAPSAGREKLYARAAITGRLNAIYSVEASSLDSALFNLQLRSLRREQW